VIEKYRKVWLEAENEKLWDNRTSGALSSTDPHLSGDNNRSLLKEVFSCKQNFLTRLLTWCIVIIHSDREVPRHVGNWIPPLYCEVDTCVHIIQLNKKKMKRITFSAHKQGHKMENNWHVPRTT
jgi:hypothetical protein